MLDLLKNGMLAGLGAVVVTREKVEEKLRKLVDEGKITREEARRTADDLLESGRGQWDEFKRRVAETVAGAVEPLGLVRRGDMEALERRVRILEDRLAAADIRLRVMEEGAGSGEPGGKGAEKA